MPYAVRTTGGNLFVDPVFETLRVKIMVAGCLTIYFGLETYRACECIDGGF